MRGGGHMWNGGMWNGSGTSWMMFLMWVIQLVVLLGGGDLLYRALTRSESEKHDVALEELRIAYARGELFEEEFEQRRERLRRETEP